MRTRAVELYLAIVMALTGTILAAEGDTLNLVYLDVLHAWVEKFPGTEARFGALLTLVGVSRMAAIIVNGYWRPTPIIRIAGCVIGSLLWATFTLSISMAAIGRPLPLVIAFSGAAMLFEWFAILCATVDAHTYNSMGVRSFARRSAHVGRHA